MDLRLQNYQQETLPETLNCRDVALMEKLMQASPEIQMSELCDKKYDKQPPKHVLLRGKAGVGKTTFLKWIANQWGKEMLWNDRFSHVITVTVRDQPELEKTTLSERLFRKLPLSTDQKHEAYEYISQHTNSLLVLVDGLDESRNFSYDHREATTSDEATDLSTMLSGIVGGIVLPGATVIVASRPTQQLPMNAFHRIVEIYGFTGESIIKYVNSFCGKDDKLREHINKNLERNPSLLTFCYIPLQCRFVCKALAYAHPHGNTVDVPAIMTMTRLYVDATTNMAKEVHPKLKNNCSDVDVDEVLQVVKEPYMKYAELARQCIMTEPLQIIFYKDDLSEVGLDENSPGDMQCGVVTQSRKLDEECMNRQHRRCWTFNHLTLLEYFSAIGLLQLSVDEIMKLLKDASSVYKHEIVISFVMGLISDKRKYTKKLLSSKITLDPRDLANKLVTVLEDDPLKLVTILHESQDASLVNIVPSEIKSEEVFPTDMQALHWLLEQGDCPVKTLK